MRKVTTLALAVMALAAAVAGVRDREVAVARAARGGAGLGGLEEGTGPLGAYGGTLPGSNVSDRVLFAVDQTTLSPEAIGILNAQVGWLRQNSSAPILIEGHADERGTGEYNMALGSSRASAVRNYMVSQGIPDSRISIITYGRERPIATCDNESCWSQNRRAVTVVTGGAGA